MHIVPEDANDIPVRVCLGFSRVVSGGRSKNPGNPRLFEHCSRPRVPCDRKLGNEDHRQILNGILWIHRPGAPWRALPRRYGPMGTVSSRFYRWRKAGIWQRILSDLQAEAEQRGEIDWDLHFVDATIVRAHQHAGGARRDGATPEEVPAREALGRSQGGFSTKLHLRAE